MKFRWAMAGALGAALFTTSALALAAGGGHHVNLHPEINWWAWDAHSPPMGWFIVNFVVFVFLLVRLAGKGVSAAFAKRSATIKENVETNERELETASGERKHWEEKLAGVGEESKELIANATADGERDREKIVNGAKEYAERLRSDTNAIMEQEAASAQRALQLEVSLQALDKAEALLRSSITDDDRARLFEQAVAQLADGKSTIQSEPGLSAVVGGAP